MLLDEAKDFKEATSSIVYDSLIKFPPTLPDSKSGRDFAKRLYLISTIEPNMRVPWTISFLCYFIMWVSQVVTGLSGMFSRNLQ